MRVALIVMTTTFASLFIGSKPPAEARGAATSRSCLPSSIKTTLAKVERRFGRVAVISTHRPGARVARSGRRSRHADCRAVDFRPASGQYRAVVAWLRQNHNGGLGTYSCGMSHIHIDNGPNYSWHTCAGSRNRSSRPRRR